MLGLTLSRGQNKIKQVQYCTHCPSLMELQVIQKRLGNSSTQPTSCSKEADIAQGCHLWLCWWSPRRPVCIASPCITNGQRLKPQAKRHQGHLRKPTHTKLVGYQILGSVHWAWQRFSWVSHDVIDGYWWYLNQHLWLQTSLTSRLNWRLLEPYIDISLVRREPTATPTLPSFQCVHASTPQTETPLAPRARSGSFLPKANKGTSECVQTMKMYTFQFSHSWWKCVVFVFAEKCIGSLVRKNIS